MGEMRDGRFISDVFGIHRRVAQLCLSASAPLLLSASNTALNPKIFNLQLVVWRGDVEVFFPNDAPTRRTKSKSLQVNTARYNL